MSFKYLFDTDTCIHLRRGNSLHLKRRFAALEAGDVAMSVVTYGELFRGALRSSDPASTMKTLNRVVQLAPVLPLPVEAGERYAQIRVALERSGMIIGSNDLWIAAHALAAGLALVTGNVREFSRVEGLRVENWISPR